MRISAIHNQVLKEKSRQLEKEIREKSPEIQMQAIADQFKNFVNSAKFFERAKIAWHVLLGRFDGTYSR